MSRSKVGSLPLLKSATIDWLTDDYLSCRVPRSKTVLFLPWVWGTYITFSLSLYFLREYEIELKQDSQGETTQIFLWLNERMFEEKDRRGERAGVRKDRESKYCIMRAWIIPPSRDCVSTHSYASDHRIARVHCVHESCIIYRKRFIPGCWALLQPSSISGFN